MSTWRSKVVTILENDSALQGLLSGSASDKRIYPTVPDQPERFPCVVHEMVDSSYRTVPSDVEDVILQLSIYTKDSPYSLEAISERLDELLNYYEEIAAAPRIVYMIRTASIDESLTDRRLFARALRYNIWFKNS